jgi:uncharacterized membrane protein
MVEQAVGTEQVKEETKPSNSTVTDSNEYQMDLNPAKIKINIFPSAETKYEVVHTVSKPTFADEEARERMMPLIISDAGKVDGAEASSMSLDDEPANVRLYDKIAVTVNGYSLEKGKKPTTEDISVDTPITVDGEEKTIKDLIPPSHKSAVINGLYPASYEVDFGGEEFYFALGGGREWKVKQEIGGKFKREDGTLSPADYTVYYIFREPTQEERKKFRSQAVSAITLKTTSGNKDRRSTNLRVVSDLFDALIQTIEGATINGTTIDVRDKKSLELIPATFKKGCVIRLMNFLEADLSD